MADVESLSAMQPFCVWAQAARNFAIHIPAEVIGSLGTESGRSGLLPLIYDGCRKLTIFNEPSQFLLTSDPR